MRTGIPARVLLLALMGLPAAAGSAHATGYTWNTDASGRWYESAKWNPAGIPTGYQHTATVFRDPQANVVVTLDGSASLNALTVGMYNTLLIAAPGGALGFGKTEATGQPYLVNNGVIGLSDSRSIAVSGDLMTFTGYRLTISGGGAISLLSGSSIHPVNYGQVIIDIEESSQTYNTISGGGSEVSPAVLSGWSSTIPLINRGAIFADAGYLKVKNVQNEPLLWVGTYHGGLLAAINHGYLVLTNSVRGGFIYPGDGSVELKGPTMAFTTIGPGTVNVTLISQLWDSHTFMSGCQINILSGTRLDLYNAAITNDGVIRIASGGALRNFQSQIALQGSGKVLLVGPSGGLDAELPGTNWIINGPEHTIEGGGVATAWVSNLGTLLANDHTLTFWGALFGTGALRIEGQDAANLAVMDYRATSRLITGSLYINEYGKLLLVNNNQIDVQQGFSHALRDESLWPMASKVLNMTGSGAWQGLEVGGEDLGLVPAGFTANFSVGTLHVHDGAKVYLVDGLDNGNRHSPEVLYVDTLVIDAGATLNLNGLRLYTYLSPAGPRELFMIDESNYTQFSHLFQGWLVNQPVTGTGFPASSIVLRQNRPNPFSPSTRIEFELPGDMPVRLDVYDVAGRLVDRLVDSALPSGLHSVDWNGNTAQGRPVGGGVYFYVLSTGTERIVRKMLLVR